MPSLRNKPSRLNSSQQASGKLGTVHPAPTAPRSVGAGRLDADALKQPEGAHPGKHLLVTMPGGWEALASQHPVMLIDDGSDVKVLVRVDAADDTTARPLLTTFPTGSPG